MSVPRPNSDNPSQADVGSSPRAVATPRDRRFRVLVSVGMVGLTLVILWLGIGRNLASQYQSYWEARQAAEDNAPIGYLGLNPRRSYNDRAVVFLSENEGRTTLFAAKRGGGEPDEVYDVTEASIDLATLEGGFGRDSIPGIDYPIIETAEGERGGRLRTRQDVFALGLGPVSRVYPRDLLEKIEMVNDRVGDAPLLIVYDRGRTTAFAFSRAVDGSVVSFGSTGYSRFKQPVLYDRKTRSLWVIENAELLCVAGSLKGRSLKPGPTLVTTTWGAWSGKNPNTTIVVGNDRSLPIPSE